MFKKHGVKVLIIAGILMIAAYIGYELITFPWVFGTDEEINAKVLPSPTMPPGEPGVDYIISTPPPGYFNESSGRVILAPNGTGQTTSPLYSSADKDGYYWLIPEEIPLGSMITEPGEPPLEEVLPEATPGEIAEETVFSNDTMIQMFNPEEAPQAEEEEVVEITAVIKIPRLNLSECIFKGTGKEALKLGIGHLEGSELPNEEGNMVIAAHRSSNNAAPF
ncbi:MAG: sortase, partial [Clostridiales bacterium]|nr:sortase [Clostridiales bacterium]